jgi:hypothetical protein
MEPLDLNRMDVAAQHRIAECGAAPPYSEPLLYINARTQLALVSEARAAARMREAIKGVLNRIESHGGEPPESFLEALRASLGGEGGNKE